jgi:hypothetical protein
MQSDGCEDPMYELSRMRKVCLSCFFLQSNILPFQYPIASAHTRDQPLSCCPVTLQVPPVARIISSAVGLVLGAAEGQLGASAGQLPPPAPWLQRMGQDPAGTLAALHAVRVIQRPPAPLESATAP